MSLLLKLTSSIFFCFLSGATWWFSVELIKKQENQLIVLICLCISGALVLCGMYLLPTEIFNQTKEVKQ